MTKETIAEFFDAAMTDKVLAGKVAALATENGHDFTVGELLEFGAARPLSDTDAANAAGGTAMGRPGKLHLWNGEMNQAE